MLYTLGRSPRKSDMSTLYGMISANDALLLLQDGVYAALAQDEISALLTATGSKIYALSNDVIARGISRQIHASIEIIDYQGFVDLTVKHPQQINW